MKIEKITAREILDSRGNPTVSVSVILDEGTLAEASVPSGASTGTGEAFELRDNDPERFDGKGVLSAVKNIEQKIEPALLGKNPENQAEIDRKLIELDGTKNKSNLGANAILAVSLAVARAAAAAKEQELFEYLTSIYIGGGKAKYHLPTPMFNILNGGKHADSGIDIQEAMIVPTGLPSFAKKLEAGAEIYQTLKNTLSLAGFDTGLGDEGGFAPHLGSNEEVFKSLTKAIAGAGYNTSKIRISTDFAASEFYDENNDLYVLKAENLNLPAEKLIEKVKFWSKKYKLFSVEDGLSESDPNWRSLTDKIKPTLTIGDDLFTTNPEKIAMLGIKEKMADGVIIKPNQIGTLTETFEAIRTAQKGKLKVIVSHRSGETEDSFIADLAVAVGAEFIKAGAPARGERLAKYNRLSKIEEIIKH